MSNTNYRPLTSARRGFLKLGASGVLGVGLLSILERFVPQAPVQAVSTMRMPHPILSPTEFETLLVFSELVVGAPKGQLTTADTRTAERVELELSKHPGTMVSDVKAALRIAEFMPLLQATGVRLTRASHAERVAVLTRMQVSHNVLIRSVYSGLRNLCLFCYYSDPAAWSRVGYAGPAVASKFYEGGNRIANLRALQGGQS